MLRGYLATGWTRAYSILSGNGYETENTKRWSSNIIASLWTYAFAMWDLRCKILHETDNNLKHTKTDNEIRDLYQAKESFLLIDQGLFAKPLPSVLAESARTKEARLIGLKAAHLRWQESTNIDQAEDAINPCQRHPSCITSSRTSRASKRRSTHQRPKHRTNCRR